MVLEKHGFSYLHYPTESELASININPHSKTLGNSDSYNEMCQRREREYIKSVIEILGVPINTKHYSTHHITHRVS
jgi:hypothetical protein